MNVLLVGGSGYVGSWLAGELMHDGIKCDICDRTPDPTADTMPEFECAYQEIDRSSLGKYSTVLWFAGHSSVKSSIEDPDGCVRNNCLDLYDFAQKLDPRCRLIYASSASLYSRALIASDGSVGVSSEDDQIVPTNNEYDISKFAFDYIARTFLDNFVGLRMGTVSGFSPRLRKDLIFNAMNLSAIEHQRVEVSNPQAFRSILFLDDLSLLIKSLLTKATDLTGFLNAASLSMSIGEIGTAIAGHYSVELVDVEPSTPDTYSFRLDTTRMWDAIGERSGTSLGDQCDKFRNAVLASAA